MVIVDVRNLEAQPRPFDLMVSATDLGLEADIRLDGSLRVNGELYRLGEKIYVRARWQGTLELSCSRCLRNYPFPCAGSFDAVAAPGGAADPDRVADDSAAEEVAWLTYAHDQLDLAVELHSGLVLAIPMKPLCRPDCPGLCAECGQPLDDRHRHADTPAGQHAFGVLANYRRPSPTPDQAARKRRRN